MTIWVIFHLATAHNLCVYQAKSFLSTQLSSLAIVSGCKINPIAVEAQWSFVIEHFHDPLRCIVSSLNVVLPAAPLGLIVNHANLATSYTIGPERFTLAILAFCTTLPTYRQQISTGSNFIKPHGYHKHCTSRL